MGTDSHTIAHRHQASLQIGLTIDFDQAVKTIADHAERSPRRCTDGCSPEARDAGSQQCSCNRVVRYSLDCPITEPDRDWVTDSVSTPEH